MCAGWCARYAITPHSVTSYPTSHTMSVIPAEAGTHESFNALSVEKNKRVRRLRVNRDTAFAASLMGPGLRRDDDRGGVGDK